MILRALLAIFTVLLLAGHAEAATHYIRDGGTASTSGTGSCTGWATANACDQLPSTLVRGDTYCIADGTYSGRIYSTATSGTTPITIRKAVHGDGVCDQGSNWSSTYGDGQANLTTIEVTTNYWVFDGITRNESNWADGNAYGFRATQVLSVEDVGFSRCATNVTFRYLNVGGAEGTTFTDTEPDFAIKGTAYTDPRCNNWTISRSYLHNVAHGTMIAGNGWENALIEYSHFRNGWGKEAIRGQIRFKNGVIRWNQFFDSCGTAPPDGCTAEIALWDGGAGDWDGNKVYGNWFYRSRDPNSGGTIVIGGNGSSWAGSPGSNNLVYNNTIAGIDSLSGGAGLILLNGGSGNECRNNLWHDAVNAVCGGTGYTASNNASVGTNPFVSYSYGTLDLHLSADTGTSWFSLGAPYNVDMDGVTRTSSIGAFQFAASSPPEAPTNFRLNIDLWLTIALLGLMGGAIWRAMNAPDSSRGGRRNRPAPAVRAGQVAG